MLHIYIKTAKQAEFVRTQYNTVCISDVSRISITISLHLKLLLIGRHFAARVCRM